MEAQEVDLVHVLALLRRQLPLIALTIFVMLAGTGSILGVLRPVYSAAAVVTVGINLADLLAPGGDAAASPANPTGVDDELERATLPTTLLRVVKTLDLVHDPEFAPRIGWPAAMLMALHWKAPPTVAEAERQSLAQLVDAVEAERQGQTSAIALEVRSVRADGAARLANALAGALVAAEREARIAAILEARDIVRGRLAAAARSMADAEDAIDAFITAGSAAGSNGGEGTGLLETGQTVAQSQSQAAALKAKLRGGLAGSDLPAPALTSLFALGQAAQSARAQYQTLIDKDKQLTAEANLQVARISVAAEALPPLSPAWPNWRLILMLAGVAGVTAGVGLAILRETLVGGFTSEAQLRSALRLPVASVLPFLKRSRGGGAGPSVPADQLLTASLSSFAEAVRRIPVSIDLALRRRKELAAAPADLAGAVVMITAASAGEGKTTVALSLARAYAAAGRETLLIDGDLRRPSLHRHLGIEPSIGLFDYLRADLKETASLDVREIFVTEPGSGLRVIVGARDTGMPTDNLIAGEALRRLLAAARQHFEIIVIDAPAARPAADALRLAEFADVILLVIRAERTPQGEVGNALSQLDEARRRDTAILAVMNAERRRWWFGLRLLDGAADPARCRPSHTVAVSGRNEGSNAGQVRTQFFKSRRAGRPWLRHNPF